MNARERVMAAVARQPVDQVPARLNCPANDVGRRVASELGIDLVDDWYEVLHQRMRSDIRTVGPQMVGCEGSNDRLNLASASSAQDVDRLWPRKWLIEHRSFQHAKAEVDAWDASGVVPAVAIVIPGGLVGMARRMRGDTLALMDLADQNDVLGRIFERMEDVIKGMIDLAYEALGDRIDMFGFGEELGMQTGLMYSPASIRAQFLPTLTRLFEHVHAGGAKTFFHTCGSVEPIIPDLIAAGVDILNPIQPKVPGMDPENLQAKFGDQVCFCGGMDMQHLMPLGTPEEIRAELRRYISCLQPGYILDLANIMHPDIPTENLAALYDTPRNPE